MNEMLEKLKAGALVLDVRTEQEFATGHYPGAVNIPLEQLSFRMGEIEVGERSILVYCLSGVRSLYAARMLFAAGFTDVLNVGGLKEMFALNPA
jgi:phage shock protein E